MSTEAELYDDAMNETAWAELYEEHAELATQELRAERLRSYYAAHLDIAEPSFKALDDARKLRVPSAAAALVRATTASEVGLKTVLLKPIVFGLIHSEAVAGLVTDMVMGHQALDRYRDLLFALLRQFGGIDLSSFRRLGARTTLWQELKDNQEIRNRVVHRAVEPSADQAAAAIAMAESVLSDLLPRVVAQFGFHLHEARLCDDPHITEAMSRMLGGVSDSARRPA